MSYTNEMLAVILALMRALGLKTVQVSKDLDHMGSGKKLGSKEPSEKILPKGNL